MNEGMDGNRKFFSKKVGKVEIATELKNGNGRLTVGEGGFSITILTIV